MRAKRAKQLRNIYKNRKDYRHAKKTYMRSLEFRKIIVKGVK